ncbi:MAG: glycoside hydrolase family 5 protein [Halococcoides sp.]
MTGETTGHRTDRNRPTRRDFLRLAGAGTLGTGLAVSATEVGAASVGIPTPWLQREGNLLVDQTGQRVTLRGVNVVDPARADSAFWRHPVPQTVEHATDPERDWYSRIIRVPVQPGGVAGANSGEPEPGSFSKSDLETYCADLLDPVVEKCAERGVYCIVDYHRHRTDDYTTQALHEELLLFWETVAPRYADRPHVLYEVYNEPIGPYVGDGQNDDRAMLDDAGEQTWLKWRETAQPWVDAIRDAASDNVVLIGSPRWSQWTWWAPTNEFSGDNLAYVGHVYTHENLRPLSKYFGEPAADVPVFISEFGYQNKRHDGAPVPDFLKGTTSTAGAEFKSFFAEHDHIHWQVWCFDHSWAPPMFSFDDATHEWTLQGGEDWQGVFFRDLLKELKDDHVPGGTALDPIEGTVPVDGDGDGLHEDFNANGRVGFPDVNRFFRHSDTDAVQNHTAAYDFTGNDKISLQDVMALFQRV